MGRETGRKGDNGAPRAPEGYLADYFNRPANQPRTPDPYDSLARSGAAQSPPPAPGTIDPSGSTIGAPADRRARRRQRRYPIGPAPGPIRTGTAGATTPATGTAGPTPPAGPRDDGSVPFVLRPTREERRAKRKERSRSRTGALLTAVVLALALGAGLISSYLGSSTSAPRSFVPGAPDLDDDADADLPVRWELHPEDLVDAGSGYPQFGAISDPHTPGPHNPPVAVTPEAWVAAVQTDDRRWITGVDPSGGIPLWERELSQGMCAPGTTEDGALVCVGRQDGDWHGYLLEASTGAELDSWEIPVTGVWGVHLSTEGLLVLSESAPRVHDRLALLDVPGGAEQWSVDLLDDDDNEWLFHEREIDGTTRTLPWNPRWRDLGPNVAMLGVTEHLLIDPAEGTVRTIACAAAVVVGDALGCSNYNETVFYDAHGQEVWTSPRVQLADPAYTEAEVPINVRDETLWAMDWASGTVGAELASVPGAPRATGTPEHPFLVGETEVLSLDAEQNRIRWSAPMSGIDSLTSVKVVDDVAVVTGWSVVGLDLESGEELWHRSRPGTLHVLDEHLVAADMFHLQALDLP